MNNSKKVILINVGEKGYDNLVGTKIFLFSLIDIKKALEPFFAS